MSKVNVTRNQNYYRPSSDMTLHIGDVQVKIKGDDANILLDKLSESVQKQHSFCVRISKQHAKDVQQLQEFIKQLRKVFFNESNFSNICYEKNLAEIDSKELSDLLNKYSKVFGFGE